LLSCDAAGRKRLVWSCEADEAGGNQSLRYASWWNQL
jgi:hypothetical protein